jgi:hypothetical protein
MGAAAGGGSVRPRLLPNARPVFSTKLVVVQFRPLVLVAIALLLIGCSNTTECLCSDADHLYVELRRPVPGGRVRVCDGARCVTGAINNKGTHPRADVRRSRLPAWSASHSTKLNVVVIDATGKAILTAKDVTTEKHHNCCGDYYEIRVG